MISNFDVEELVEEKVKTVQKGENSLVLYNDEVNSFQEVILALTLICDHSPIQAEQCAMIAHNTGKCVIKTGNYLVLEKMKYKLEDINLTVEIQ